MAKPTKAHPIRSTQPYLHHDTLTQDQQAKYLGVKQETVLNLGHPVPISEIEKNPAGRVMNYDSADTARTFRDPPKLQGVYKSAPDPRSSISSEQNIDAWSRRASANSFDGKDGKEPPMRDQGRSSVPSPARSKNSDGYLADQPSPSTDNWASFRAGSESGEGRLEKLHKR
jgi:hypothetical protein